MKLNYSELLETAIIASIKAGEEILKIYATEFEITEKEDSSPLTLADRNAHHTINSLLKYTGIPVLSEEGKEISYSERLTWDYLWIVDPLDGTKEFIKKNGEFTVNIALVFNGNPVLGVIYQPVNSKLYFAAKGKGAFVVEVKANDELAIKSIISGAKRLPLNNAPRKFSIVASRSHLNPETAAFINELKKQHGEIDLVSAGSSLKFCLVAEGSADVYPRFAPTMEWDTAAGQAIVEEAGKRVIDFTTDLPMKYNKEIIRNNWFLVQ